MRDKHGIGQAIVMITQLSINMLVPVFMCLFIGIWLDKRLGTGWLTLVFLILGIMASIRSLPITSPSFAKNSGINILVNLRTQNRSRLHRKQSDDSSRHAGNTQSG